jgi:hypothetical protein
MRLSRPFFWSLGIIFAAIMNKIASEKTPVATGRVCNFVREGQAGIKVFTYSVFPMFFYIVIFRCLLNGVAYSVFPMFL